ncbi:MAG TPA: hypothetical protein VF111_02230 [Thermoanaerobaculia bacterium]
MNKVLLGAIVGAILGVFDGATAWFTPEVRPEMLTIIIGSTVKGIMAGVAAGLFARWVHSTVAGVVFGIVVGLGLAYWVASMQDKYYFEIMLPGSIVGAILGWTTQRYGRPARTRNAAAIAMLLFSLVSMNAQAATTARQAFEKIKGRAGTWNAHMMTADGAPTVVDYRVTGAGTTVMETMFAGSPHEMITMYTLDGDSVVATHYCSMGNQPVMKLNLSKSTDDVLLFDFVSVSGKAGGHINGARLTFSENKEEWLSEGSEPKTLYLATKK